MQIFCSKKSYFFLRSEEQNHSLTKKSIITQRVRAFTLNSKECRVYDLILPSREDSACTSFFGTAGLVGSQQFSFAIVLTARCQFRLVSIAEMKNCNEILAKIFLKSAPKINGKMQCNFSKDAERW